jgi:hypothetical protein
MSYSLFETGMAGQREYSILHGKKQCSVPLQLLLLPLSATLICSGMTANGARGDQVRHRTQGWGEAFSLVIGDNINSDISTTDEVWIRLWPIYIPDKTCFPVFVELMVSGNNQLPQRPVQNDQ